MVPRPIPTAVYHFTHVRNLLSIAHAGLVADIGSRTGRTVVEVGEPSIKEARRQRAVPVGPGGVVGDYVPFYFAARSPMLYKIHRGGVPSYQDGCDDLIYLVSTVERLQSEGCPLVFTDRNAATSIAEFTDEENRLGELIDWPLMNARIWRDVPAQPDRKERRMAECLAYRQVPWSAFVGVATRTEGCADAARATLATLGDSTPVVVRPGWYF